MNYFIIPGLKAGHSPIEIVRQISVASTYDVEVLLGNRRYGDLPDARHVAMYIIKKRCGISLVKIAEMFNTDHSTVLKGIRKVNDGIYTQDKIIMEYLRRMDEVR